MDDLTHPRPTLRDREQQLLALRAQHPAWVIEYTAGIAPWRAHVREAATWAPNGSRPFWLSRVTPDELTAAIMSHTRVLTEQDRADLAELTASYGDQWTVEHTTRGWQATPRPNPADVLAAADADSLRWKLEAAEPRREMST
jgi:hypothetical protein